MAEDVLVLLAEGRARIERARSLPEVAELRDQALAMQHYYQQRQDGAAAAYAASELVLRAERRLGSMCPSGKGASRGHRKLVNVDGLFSEENERRRLRSLAAVPDDSFERYLARCASVQEPATRTGALRCASVSEAEGYDGDSWGTPLAVIERVRDVMSTIDLDPASNTEAQTVVRASGFFTKEDNGLEHEWHGRVFCNPPYSVPLIQYFTKKLMLEFSEGRTTEAIYLVNNCTDAGWFQDLVMMPGVQVCFTRGRIKFLQGGVGFATRQGQAIFHLGGNPLLFFAAFKDLGTILEPVQR